MVKRFHQPFYRMQRYKIEITDVASPAGSANGVNRGFFAG